jgi:hypothetical protein
MNRKISRRDFVNGCSAGAVGAALWPQWAAAQEFAPEQSSDYYRPAMTGMRCDHAGSFEVAHQLRDTRQIDLPIVQLATSSTAAPCQALGLAYKAGWS